MSNMKNLGWNTLSGSITAVGLVVTLAAPAWSAQEKPAANVKTALNAGQGSSAATAKSTIFWGVDKTGVLLLSDRPASNVSQTGSATFASRADRSALARAEQERAYWRDQADRFSARQRDRDRELEVTRRIRLLDSRDIERGGYYSPPVYYRGADWFAQQHAPLVGGFPISATYTSSPGVASTAPASFIGSGFSSAGRR